jgi:hypothetical protein
LVWQIPPRSNGGRLFLACALAGSTAFGDRARAAETRASRSTPSASRIPHAGSLPVIRASSKRPGEARSRGLSRLGTSGALLHDTQDQLLSGGPDERFELGLDIILRGIASYLEEWSRRHGAAMQRWLRAALVLARDLDQVAAGVVEDGSGNASHVRRLLRKPNAEPS